MLADGPNPHVHSECEVLNQHLNMCAYLETHAVTLVVFILPHGPCALMYVVPKFVWGSHLYISHIEVLGRKAAPNGLNPNVHNEYEILNQHVDMCAYL